ncbi:hypothetical protein ACJRO7_015888 [Eucalyptus globulus]|uniref:RBR-type E3 ubiquitin transferase n=1 Tax=Eucalyptus globulus TaxID=34317 RepID=A0ABD3L587_EUCGL
MATEEFAVEVADADRRDVPASRFAPIAAGGDATSVEQYTEDRGLYDAIAASLLQSRSKRLNEGGGGGGGGDGDGDGEVRVPDRVPAGTPSSSSRKRKKRPCSGSSVAEPGQPSNSEPDPSFVCEICAVPRTKKVLFRIAGCGHACCGGCVTEHVASKLRDGVTRVDCPVSGCGGVLEPVCCSSMLPPEVFDRWGNALCEALISEAERFYCPFTDCSALLIDDGGAVVRESECPDCRRLFCAQCRVPWHAGLECQEFQGLDEGEKGREDTKIELAPLSSSRKPKRKRKPCGRSLVIEADQPSNSEPNPSFICEICVEPRMSSDPFRIKGCSHAYCNDCITRFVTSKLLDNVMQIECPVSGCVSNLEPEDCRSILPSEVFDRWDDALCDALILEGERFYCPFKDCSALLINDGGAVVRESECPNCRRLFCAQCRVPWHAGVECREFQELDEGERGRKDTKIELAPSSSSRKPKQNKKPDSGPLVIEADQPLNSEPDPSFICEICVEPRMNGDLFCIKNCSHAYCNDCITKFVTSKLHDNIMHIDCPVLGCGGVLEPEYCRSILPPEVFDRWGNALCEALILEAERFYCPFKDCSALLINDGGAVVRESECPNCRRLFCAQCKVPWHAGVECQELNEGEREREDIMLMKLAEKKHWRRCPKCRFFVQKKSGCAFVKCRCGVEFCYRCGAEAKLSHYCNNCRC